MKHHPPIRLREDPSVGPALRDELARARSAGLSGYDVAAGLARFEASLEPGGGHDGGAGQAPPAAPSAGLGAGAKSLLAPALMGALAGVVAIGLASAVSTQSPSSRERAAVATTTALTALARAASSPPPSPEPPKPPAQPAIAPHASDSPDPPIAPTPSGSPPRAAPTPRAAPEPADTPAAPPDPPAAPATPPAAAPAPSGGPDALALEMENLTRLRALEASDPAGALALAAEGQRRFPGGLFAQEREAIAIGALARLGRAAEARARVNAFLAAYPKSAFAERLRRLTGAGH